jgi:hypothetical protein
MRHLLNPTYSFRRPRHEQVSSRRPSRLISTASAQNSVSFSATAPPWSQPARQGADASIDPSDAAECVAGVASGKMVSTLLPPARSSSICAARCMPHSSSANDPRPARRDRHRVPVGAGARGVHRRAVRLHPALPAVHHDGTLAGTPLGGGPSPFPFAAAAGLVAAVAVLVSGIAARTTVPADIS